MESEDDWANASSLAGRSCTVGTTAPIKRRRVKGKQPIERHLSMLPGHEQCNLAFEAWRMLQCFQVPDIFFHILAIMNICGSFRNASDLDCVEWFCGQREITHAAQRAGFDAVGYDYDQDNQRQNMNTPIGMIVALQWARRLRKLLESLGWFGTVCSSWIFLCRGTSKRTVYRPLGDTNIFCARGQPHDCTIGPFDCLSIFHGCDLVLGAAGVFLDDLFRADEVGHDGCATTWSALSGGNAVYGSI